MKPTRTLLLRREMLGDLSGDDLAAVAGAQPPTLKGCADISDEIQCTLYCPATLRPFLCGRPTDSPVCRLIDTG